MTGFRQWMEDAGFLSPPAGNNDGMGVRSKFTATDAVRQKQWGSKSTDSTKPSGDNHKPPEETFGFTDNNPLQQTNPVARMKKKMAKK